MAHQAQRTSIGSQLGLGQWARVEWKGRRGLLLLLLKDYWCPALHILVLHVGGNDLGLVKGKDLVIQVKKDLRVIKEQWLGVCILQSAIIPRLSWKGAWCPGAMERA